jgi:Peptidase family S51
VSESRATTQRLFLLGPQRLRPTVVTAVRALGVSGADLRVATVTAGWQEAEGEDQELRDHLVGDTTNLELYRRAERVFGRDPGFATAHRERQELFRRMQVAYRARLRFAIDACREMGRGAASGDDVYTVEWSAAMDAVRDLDRAHLDRIREVRAAFDERWGPLEREHIASERAEIREILGRVDVLAIAGGQVAVLLNRLRLFGIGELWGRRPVVAWSAGAMVLAERLVVFHDSPPHGPGNPEILDVGLGWCRGVVPLPHARRRLILDDTERVSRTATRFRPDLCVALDDGCGIEWTGARWAAWPGTRLLHTDGSVTEMEPAATAAPNPQVVA